MTNFKQIIPVFINHLENYEGKSKYTLRNYTTGLNKLCQFLIAEYDIRNVEDIKKIHISNFVFDLKWSNKEKDTLWIKLATSTVALYLSAVRMFIKYCNDDLELKCIDYTKIDAICVKYRKIKSIDDDMVKKFIDIPHEVEKNELIAMRNSIFIRLLYETWVRISEALWIKMIDVWQKIFIKWKWWKNRFVVISEELREDIHYFEWAIDSEWLFPRLNEWLMWEVVSCQSMQWYIQKYRKLIWNDFVTPHVFRHSFATENIKQWTEMNALAKMLWHSSITTTEKYLTVHDQTIMDCFREFQQYVNKMKKGKSFAKRVMKH